jgi:hypothetical protein
MQKAWVMAVELSRRALMSAIAALSASWGLGAASGASASPRMSVPSGSHLVSLWEEWQACRQSIDEAEEEMFRISQYIEQLGLPKWRPRMSEAEERARSAAYNAAYVEAGYEAAQQRKEEAWERFAAAEEMIAAQGADGLLGVLVRVRILALWRHDCIQGQDTGLIAATRCDLERLAAEAGLYLPINQAIDQWHERSEAAVEAAERRRIAAGVELYSGSGTHLPPVGRRACDVTAATPRSQAEVAPTSLSTFVTRVLRIPPPTPADERLAGLWQEWQTRYLAWMHASDVQGHLWPEWPGYGASCEARDAYIAAYTALQDTPEYKTAKQQTEHAWETLWALECELAEGEAEGLLGILVRARVLSSWRCVDRRDQDDCLLNALRRDLERLAARTGSVPPANESVRSWWDMVDETARLYRENRRLQTQPATRLGAAHDCLDYEECSCCTMFIRLLRRGNSERLGVLLAGTSARRGKEP